MLKDLIYFGFVLVVIGVFAIWEANQSSATALLEYQSERLLKKVVLLDQRVMHAEDALDFAMVQLEHMEQVVFPQRPDPEEWNND